MLYKGGRIHTLTPFSQHPHTDTFDVHTSPPSNITLHLIKLFILTYLPGTSPLRSPHGNRSQRSDNGEGGRPFGDVPNGTLNNGTLNNGNGIGNDGTSHLSPPRGSYGGVSGGGESRGGSRGGSAADIFAAGPPPSASGVTGGVSGGVNGGVTTPPTTTSDAAMRTSPLRSPSHTSTL